MSGWARQQFVWLVAACVLAWGAPALAVPAPPCSRADDFREVAGQGPSCREGQLWKMRLPDGGFVLTHGPDAAPGEEEPADGAGLIGWPAPTMPRAPLCTNDLGTNYMGLIVFATPSDKPFTPERVVEIEPQIKDLFMLANGRLREEAERFGLAASYRMLCQDWDGRPWTLLAQLRTPSTSDSFSTIVGDLRTSGVDWPRTKYWVWYDDGVGNFGGQGSIWNDDRPTADNPNNGGTPMYGITYGFLSMRIMMHENGHNLGAVQLSAPHTTGGWHCNDGKDIMCYSDGGPTANYNELGCPTKQFFDCGNNDYFHPAPLGASYLATHWNLGSRVNRYIQVATLAEVPSAPQGLTAVPWGYNAIRLAWLSPNSQGTGGLVSHYTVYRGTCVAQVDSSPAHVGNQENYLTRIAANPSASPQVYSWTDFDIDSTTNYFYHVAAVNPMGESPLSNRAATYGVNAVAPAPQQKCDLNPAP